MRNFFFLLLCVGLVSFSSCGDDDDNSSSLTTENIAGTWNVTAYSNEGDITALGSTTSTSSVASNSTLTITFNDGGTWTSAGTYTLTTTSDGTTDTEEVDGLGGGTYTISNGSLTLQGLDAGDESDVEVPLVLNVDSFVENMLIELSGNTNETIMDPFFGLEITIDLDTDMTLER